MPLRVLIADDHEAIRLGLRHILASKAGMEICGEAADGDEAVNKVRDLIPDVVILDLTMPAKSGFQAAYEIHEISPYTRIVFFSMHNVPFTAREVGADAFVSKSAPVNELLAAIERVGALHSRGAN
jgi:two-component system response regulator NreC